MQAGFGRKVIKRSAGTTCDRDVRGDALLLAVPQAFVAHQASGTAARVGAGGTGEESEGRSSLDEFWPQAREALRCSLVRVIGETRPRICRCFGN
ncbi:hypothetical protein [Xanthomonas sacchari]|uniref:hypothetical protein n=1 Tax=Xanthomonas sacchari TaxID=56458 RepID=UPI0027D7A938|nr:hypothetical protein [Xanthomonas sacchari]